MSDSQKFSVAAHLYARLRRNGGRVIDVQFMLRDEKYAREILAHARSLSDPEIRGLAERYADLLAGIVRKPPGEQKPAMPSVRGGDVAPPVPETKPETEEERALAARYRGGLR